MADVPHFQFPFARTGGKLAVVEQDTGEHVESCVDVILNCPAGFRDERPDFGIPWPEYHNTVDVQGIEEAVRRLEPRVQSTSGLVDRAQAAMGEADVQIEAGY